MQKVLIADCLKYLDFLLQFILNPWDRVMVTENHRLGFSNMDHTCPISFKYAEEGRTLFKYAQMTKYKRQNSITSIHINI